MEDNPIEVTGCDRNYDCQRIIEGIYDRTVPPLFTEISDFEYQGKLVIAISVKADGKTYTTTDGRCLKRLGRNSKPAYPDELSNVYSSAKNPDFSGRIIGESIVAWEASQAALSNVYEYVEKNSMDLSCVDHMPIEVMDISMKAFLTEYIWGSVMKDLECRVEKYMEDVSSACEREKEIKDTIEAVVDVEYGNHGSLIQGDVNEAVSKLTERCFEVLQGII